MAPAPMRTASLTWFMAGQCVTLYWNQRACVTSSQTFLTGEVMVMLCTIIQHTCLYVASKGQGTPMVGCIEYRNPRCQLPHFCLFPAACQMTWRRGCVLT